MSRASLQRLARMARYALLDNTFAGFHNHGQLDIDLFVHSLTKYASGHGDVLGGAIIGSGKLLATMKPDSIVVGATLDPHAAFLIQRGLKTYFLRFERHCANAVRVAEFLTTHPKVQHVRFPGLPTHPQHSLARSQMVDFGTLVTFDVKADRAAARAFAEALQLFAISASLGSTESLIQPGQLMRPRDLTEQEREWAAISDATMRLSIGIEDADDLIADLAQALERVG